MKSYPKYSLQFCVRLIGLDVLKYLLDVLALFNFKPSKVFIFFAFEKGDFCCYVLMFL